MSRGVSAEPIDGFIIPHGTPDEQSDFVIPGAAPGLRDTVGRPG